MSGRALRRLGWVPALLLAGCSTTSPGNDFADVQKRVADRTGQAVEWSQVSAGAGELRDAVDALLAEELTADGAVRAALLNNRRLQAVYAELGIAGADLAQAGLLSNPVLEASAKLRGGEIETLELSLVSSLLDALFLPMRRQLARADLERAKLGVTLEVVDLVGETRRAFYALQSDYQSLELWRTALLAAESSYEMSRRLREAGNIPELDHLTERDLYEQTKLQVAAAEMRVLQGREQLNRLMGLWGPASAAWQPAGRLPELPAEDSPVERIEAEIVEASLDLQNARLGIEAAARRLGLGRFETVFPEGELGVEAEREDGEWAAGPLVALPLPIFDSGRASRARARAEIRRQWELYTALAVDLRSAGREAALRLRTARQRAEYYRNVVIPLRRAITEQTQLRYNAMFLGVFQLLDAKRREIDAGREYIEALRDYWTARADLDQLRMGSLTFGEVPEPGFESEGLHSVSEGAEKED